MRRNWRYIAAMLSKPVAPPSQQGWLAPDPHRHAPTMTVLLTGFAPFGGDSMNSSWEAVRGLHGSMIEGHAVVTEQLPTEFDTALEQLIALVRRHQPVLVVCAGQASERSAISLERVAINLSDARIPDNAGAQPIDTPVISGGQPAYFSSLPIKAILRDLTQAGLMAEVSNSAGTFVCNHVFYGLMHDLQRRHAPQGVRGGFVHLPRLAQPGNPSMALHDMREGLRIVIASTLATLQDVRLATGASS